MELVRQSSGEQSSHHLQQSPVAISPSEIVNDISNAVQEYCAQGVSAMEECAAASLSLEREQLDSLLQGTAQIHQCLQSRLAVQLQNFQQYATETCLHIPVGLIPAEAEPTCTSEQYDDASEGHLDLQLANLREQIVMTQRRQRQIQQEIARLDQEVITCGSAAQLAAVAAASDPEKENLAEGASAMVNAALRLQPLMARAKKLRATDRPAADGNNAGVVAEDEILKQEALVHMLPTRRLHTMTEALQTLATTTNEHSQTGESQTSIPK